MESIHLSPWLFVPVIGGLVVIGLLLIVGRIPVTYNLRNLIVRWRITALTALAFTLVVSLLICMLAFVNGMNQLNDRAGQPGNVIVLSNGATDEVMSNLSISDARDIETHPGIVHDDRGEPLISREVYVTVAQPIPGKNGGRATRRIITLRGVEEPRIAAGIRSLDLVPGGEWFSEAGVRDVPDPAGGKLHALELVLGESVAGEWALGVGDVFDVGQRQAVVVGILRSAGSAFGSEAWGKRQIIGLTFGKESSYSSVLLRTANADKAKSVADELTHEFKKAALSAETEKEYYSKLSNLNSGFLAASYVVAVVMAVGGVFGVMNTMFAAISQRKGDIGIMRLLGFKRWQVLVSFFTESLVIALVGGAIGCALGAMANGFTATSLVAGKSLTFALIVDANTIAVAVLFTLCMGAAGGLVPSLSAMRVKPLESLR